MYQHAQANLPAEIVSPVVAYLAHESCPVTAECIDSVGGKVQRTYLATTPGFTDSKLTIESVAEHWKEVMAGTSDQLLGHGLMDPVKDWSLKPYRPTVKA